MKKYIISGINFFDNELNMGFFEGENWKESLSKHRLFDTGHEEDKDLSWLSDDLKTAKKEAGNADMLFEIIEIVD